MLAILSTGRPMKRGIFSYHVIPDPMIAKKLFREHNAHVLQVSQNILFDHLKILPESQCICPLYEESNKYNSLVFYTIKVVAMHCLHMTFLFTKV